MPKAVDVDIVFRDALGFEWVLEHALPYQLREVALALEEPFEQTSP